MTSFVLKLIAIITMVIDHTGYVFFPDAAFMRVIGRISFPIFVFLSAEACRKTKSLPKYMLRLFVFAFISEVVFDLAFFGTPFYPSYQNVFFTLFLGAASVWLYKLIIEKTGKKWLAFSAPAVCAATAGLIFSDYGAAGVLMIFFTWFVGQNIGAIAAVMLLGCLAISVKDYFAYNGYPYAFIEMFGLAALIPIFFYNGKRGPGLKYIFFVFYPAHLLIIYLIKLFVS